MMEWWLQDLGYAVGEWATEKQQPKPPKHEKNYKTFVRAFFSAAIGYFWSWKILKK